MNDFLPIDTPRLRLRRLGAHDAPALAATRNDPELARYQGWSAMDLAQARAFVDEMQSAPAFVSEEWLQVAIAARATDALVGDIGLCLHADGDCEVGFTLARAWHGQGLATEALRALLPALWAQPAVVRVVGITDARNLASARVLERLGMAVAGRERVEFRGAWCTEVRYVLERPR